MLKSDFTEIVERAISPYFDIEYKGEKDDICHCQLLIINRVTKNVDAILSISYENEISIFDAQIISSVHTFNWVYNQLDGRDL